MEGERERRSQLGRERGRRERGQWQGTGCRPSRSRLSSLGPPQASLPAHAGACSRCCLEASSGTLGSIQVPRQWDASDGAGSAGIPFPITFHVPFTSTL